jgi:hypothetical protein
VGEKSEAGSQSKVVRHQPASDSVGVSADALPSSELIQEHIERHVGPVDTVHHELVSERVHIDVNHVKPNPDRPFHTLVTSGMSDLPMAAPPGAESCIHAELVALLPADWPFSDEPYAVETDDDRDWPLNLLRFLARMPHEYNTWLWVGHTVPNGDPPRPFAPSTQLCCSFLLPPVNLGEDFMVLEVPDGREIFFFSLVPLYREEMEYKMKKGTEALFKRFAKAGLGDVIDPMRVNVCAGKKGLFG